MPGCFVPNCNSGYMKTNRLNKLTGSRNASLFSAPKSEAMLLRWRRAIRRTDKVLTSNDKVCERHFTKADVDRFYEERIADGTMFRLERGTTLLKPDAVPSIFPGPSSSLTEINSFQPAPSSHHTQVHIVRVKEELPSLDMSTMLSEDVFNFEILKQMSNLLPKPDVSWIANCLEKYIIWVKWSDTFISERQLVITEDLNVKVFLKGKEIDLMSEIVVDSIDCVENLLSRVNDLVICPGIDRQSPGCLGYKENNLPDSLDNHIMVCKSCYNNKQLPCAATNRRRESFLKREDRRMNVAAITMRKNRTLEIKVDKLKQKVKILKLQCELALKGP